MSPQNVFIFQLGDRLGCPTTTSSEALIHCLRSTPLTKLMQAAAAAQDEDHGLASPPRWAPSYDGVVVQNFAHSAANAAGSSSILSSSIPSYFDLTSRFEVMFGLSSGESLNLAFNDRQIQFGMDVKERNKAMFNIVNNAFKDHVAQMEIFSSILTAYTDWSSGHIHPVGIMENCVEAFTDAFFTAPITETADLHAGFNKEFNNNDIQAKSKTFMFVFDHQSKNRRYKKVENINGKVDKCGSSLFISALWICSWRATQIFI